MLCMPLPHACILLLLFFFFNDPATTEIYTLSLHDALPISSKPTAPSANTGSSAAPPSSPPSLPGSDTRAGLRDRKSTRLNSSHSSISYAVFCLKKKKKSAELATNHTLLAHATSPLLL